MRALWGKCLAASGNLCEEIAAHCVCDWKGGDLGTADQPKHLVPEPVKVASLSWPPSPKLAVRSVHVHDQGAGLLAFIPCTR